MAVRYRVGFVLALVGFTAVPERIASASILERVVAVVGDRPILLSELKQRARPHLGAAGAESSIFREVLDRMIDERLEEIAADKARVTVTPAEVDKGLQEVARQTRLTTDDVVAEAKRQGLSEQDYREEIRRQVLEGKLIQLRVRGRVLVTDQDVRAAYSRWLTEVSVQAPIDLRTIVFQIPPGASRAAANAVAALALQVARRAQSGTNFCALVQQYNGYSGQATTSCGSYGPVPKAMLMPELAKVAEGLEAGQTADPLLFDDPMGNHAYLVVQRSPAPPRLPALDDVREQMTERAVVQATEHQRRQWLQELRRRTYVDVRL